jgi:hypothetical protein
MVLMICALGCAGHLHAIPPAPGLDTARLYDDVQAACPAAPDPLAPG